MKSFKSTFVILFVTGIGIARLQAQEAVPASGGIGSGIGGSVSYSIGQVVDATYSGVSGYVTQGVQQPYEISVINGAVNGNNISLQCSAFPNPTTNYLTLEISPSSTLDIPSLSFQLFDLDGRLIDSHILVDNRTKINMSFLKPNIYLLKVMDGGTVLKTFKIIKH